MGEQRDLVSDADKLDLALDTLTCGKKGRARDERVDEEGEAGMVEGRE